MEVRYKKDLTGQKFNRLTVLSPSHNSPNNGTMWNCICDCEYTEESGSLVTRPEVRHSERNCLKGLEKSNETSVGSLMFTTHACCLQCAVDIVDSGVQKVYYRHQYRSTEGLEYLVANGVQVEQI